MELLDVGSKLNDVKIMVKLCANKTAITRLKDKSLN